MQAGQPRSMSSGMFAVAAMTVVAVFGITLVAQSRRDFTVSAKRYSYRVDDRDEAVIRVKVDDIVHVTFSAEDIPHSFTIDQFRISRRAEPGKPVSFEFHANQVGEFEIYCNLAIDERCRRELHGTLIVEARDPEPSHPAR